MSGIIKVGAALLMLAFMVFAMSLWLRAMWKIASYAWSLL